MVDGYGELRVASDEESTIDEPVGLSGVKAFPGARTRVCGRDSENTNYCTVAALLNDGNIVAITMMIVQRRDTNK